MKLLNIRLVVLFLLIPWKGFSQSDTNIVRIDKRTAQLIYLDLIELDRLKATKVEQNLQACKELVQNGDSLLSLKDELIQIGNSQMEAQRIQIGLMDEQLQKARKKQKRQKYWTLAGFALGILIAK